MDVRSLSDEERDAILRLGVTESEFEAIRKDTLTQLLSLGILYKKASDGHLDFTDLGEEIHEALSKGEHRG